ncbi:T9SS type A sorting domain-containing protein [Hymenobacter sp. BT664]|uniref:T9SS type A sorting domain-containing protein n=1 Tax=Hymenobacter montanus TaxID=2771359 RepID=A0A927BF87_9BACT|nr:T9SS type A sorting domain-containing protein [Hymenobacter montanus]MBD2768932.1 T9SS type A sorting domain-containing protein [Hymenobacter montanus]
MKHLFFAEWPLLARPVPTWMLGLLALLVVQSHYAYAQFPRAESFQNSTTIGQGFRLGGTAKLTAANPNPIDPQGAGYLRLTSAGNDQAGFAIDRGSFPAPQGFSISFEFFAYGGNGADGFSVFLVDADKTSANTFTPGASGGSLGYAQKTINPLSDGVPFGYIGIGIDEYGNYANGTEGRVGGINTPNLTPDAVSIRGAGNGRSATDYPYLAGSPTLPFSLDVPTARAQAGSNDYRRAYIDVVPQNTTPITYKITVRIQHGSVVETAVNGVSVPTPPSNLRIGFSGSTGGSTNFHEIRALEVKQTPILSDDLASTNYNQPVSINLLSNDLFLYANYAPGSCDLDPTTPGVQQVLNLPQGQLTVSNSGVATFTPNGTFAGVVTVPYTAADVLNVSETPPLQANPANITIIVRGADITNAVSGPTAATPGSQVEYTVTTSNLGTLSATNVVPTLQLSAGLTNVVVSNGGTYNAGSGLVTFSTTSLAAGGTPATNTVSFTAPNSGSVTGTTGNTSTEPDPVATNNISSITTLITGIANVAGVCATPGKDGISSIGLGSAPNTYFPGQSITNSGGASNIVLGAALTGTGASSTPITAGDLVLVMQMQGATLNTSQSAAYGSGGSQGKGNITTSEFTAGLYEYAVATNSVSALSGGTLTLDRVLTNTYANLDYDAATNTGQRRFQVIRVPQYSALTVADSVAGAAWNGRAGGVLAVDVAGRTTFSGNALLTMTGRGFRGGAGRALSGTGDESLQGDEYRTLSTANANGQKGEGTAGTPRYVNNDGTLLDTGVEGYRDGSSGRGAPGNAGGGGTDLFPRDNSRNSGGGGGANGGASGLGGYGLGYVGNTSDNAQGIGGDAFGASVGRLAMGGGGGAGSAQSGGMASSGSRGGGIVILRTGLVAGSGRVNANGLNSASTTNAGAGGGGGGGSVLLLAANASTLSNLTVSAKGGRGGSANRLLGAAYGPGGGGGGGAVLANGTPGSFSAVGGQNGTTTVLGASFGATKGADATIQTNAPGSGSGNTVCLPALNVSMSTTTPVRVRSSATGPIKPAVYTITVANTGGTATGVSVLSTLQANVFKYDGAGNTTTVTLKKADNSTSTPTYTAPANGVSVLEFGGLTIPAGATLTTNFQATIDPLTAQNNFPYQASAAVSYDNPRRTSAATGTIQPGGNYAGGVDASLDAAGGRNYTSSSSTAEDVTITAPLPVSLARFTAVALRLDAQLRWTTASEHNNDRFVVERSLDGYSFEAVGNVRGQNNSSRSTDYEFIDAGAARLTASNKPVYYRLRQVDIDGSSVHSSVRDVLFGGKGVVAVYPNPAGYSATLDLSSLPIGNYSVQVLDLTGRQVANYSLPGTARHPLDLQSLAVGTYMVRVSGGAMNQSLLLTRE